MADKKYKFVEEFERPPEEMEKDIGSPKLMSTKFGERYLHRIARCEYKTQYDEEGNKVRVEVKGKLGGWIEGYGNLSQEGSCWVHPGAIACMSSTIIGNAQLKSGEIGDWVVLRDNAVVKGNVELKEGATLLEDAYVEGNVKISGRAVIGCAVKGGSKISGNVRVLSDVSRSSDEVKNANEGEVLPMAKDILVVEDSEIEGNVFIVGTESKISKSKISGMCEGKLSRCDITEATLTGSCVIHGDVIGPIYLEDVFVGRDICGDINESLKYYRKRKKYKEFRGDTPVGIFAYLHEALDFSKKA